MGRTLKVVLASMIMAVVVAYAGAVLYLSASYGKRIEVLERDINLYDSKNRQLAMQMALIENSRNSLQEQVMLYQSANAEGNGGGAGGKLPVAYRPYQAKASGGTVLNLSGIRPAAGEQAGLSSIAAKLAGIKKNPGSSVRSGVQYTGGGASQGSGSASPAPVTRAS